MKKTVTQNSLSNLPFHYITTEAQLLAGLSRLEPYPEIALDSETGVRPEWVGKVDPMAARLCPHMGHISILTLCGKDKPEVIDLLQLKHNNVNLEPIYRFLETRTYCIAHFAGFDGKMLMGEFKRNTINWWCTLQADKVLSNATGSKFGNVRGHSLYACLRDYFNIYLEGKGTTQISNWDLEIGARTLENPAWLEMVTYAASDVKYLHLLKDRLNSWITNPLPADWLNRHTIDDKECGFNMQQVLELEMQMVNCAIEMEFYGFPVSNYLINEFHQAITVEMYDLACDLCDLLNIPLPPDDPALDYLVPYRETLKTFNNPKKLVSILNELGIITTDAQKLTLTRVLSLMQETANKREDSEGGEIIYLNQDEEEKYKEIQNLETSILVENSKVLQTLLKYKQAVKQQGTNYAKYVNPATGHIHPSIQGPVSTGRMAMGNPNLQQVSNSTEVWIMLELDETNSIQHYSSSKLLKKP